MQIAIASDHAGYDLKHRILTYLSEQKIAWDDLGTDGHDSVDYPDYAAQAASLVSEGVVKRGILVCGTGVGMSITANKFPGVRAALCHNLETAEASRRHNDANILVLGGRVLEKTKALSILKTWLNTPFDGGRHQRRIDKIRDIEQIVKKGEAFHLKSASSSTTS